MGIGIGMGDGNWDRDGRWEMGDGIGMGDRDGRKETGKRVWEGGLKLQGKKKSYIKKIARTD